jgi:hypothetical protein
MVMDIETGNYKHLDKDADDGVRQLEPADVDLDLDDDVKCGWKIILKVMLVTVSAIIIASLIAYLVYEGTNRYTYNLKLLDVCSVVQTPGSCKIICEYKGRSYADDVSCDNWKKWYLLPAAHASDSQITTQKSFLEHYIVSGALIIVITAAIVWAFYLSCRRQ